MRSLLSFFVALCLALGGGVVAVEHHDTATPILTQGKLKLADAALVKPPQVKVPAGLSPDQLPTAPPRATAFGPPPLVVAPALPIEPARAGVITPAALLSFAAHPTRAGP